MPGWALLGSRHHVLWPPLLFLVLSLLVQQQWDLCLGLSAKSVTMSDRTPAGSGVGWPGSKSGFSSLCKVVGLEQSLGLSRSGFWGMEVVKMK